MPFSIGSPLELNLYIPTVFEIFGPQNIDEAANQPTNTTDRNTSCGGKNVKPYTHISFSSRVAGR